MKRLVTVLLVLSLMAVMSLGTFAAPAKKYNIATVVKLSGVNWFNRMEVGVKRFAKDTGHNAFQLGPAKADAALQVQIIEDLIAQKVDAICVVPFSWRRLVC